MEVLSSLFNLICPPSILDISKWTRTIALLGIFVVVSRIIKLAQGIRSVDSLPGFRIPFGPLSVPGGILPITWWNPNFEFVWKWRKDGNIYHRFGNDSVSFVPFIYGAPIMFTQSLEVASQILLGGLEKFDKSPEFEGPFKYWGPNIIDAYGSKWRKHRKITTPAFNNDTYASVWDASRKLFAEMVLAQGWASRDIVNIPSISSITFKFSLTIFTSVGFGLPLIWSKSSTEGNELSVRDCLEIITNTFVFTLVAPSWAWRLPFKWVQRTRRAYDAMNVFIRSQINTIREIIRTDIANGEANSGKDLFTLLIRASEDAGNKRGLTDDELIGNVFSFLYAGHDTTAHGLAATLAFLAIHAEIQDEIAAQVRQVAEDREGDTLLFEDYGKLDKVLAAFYEAIRMIPPGPIVPRETKQDTVINISDTNQPRMLTLKKGTQVVIDLVGLHHHSRYFSDPEVYRPSRWYAKKQDHGVDGKEGAEDFIGFSFGPRACIGRKYSTTEAVCFLSHFLWEWRVEPLLSVQPNGQIESVEEWRERVLQAEMRVTLGIKDYGIRFVRRR